MPIPAFVATTIETWADFYDHHQLVSVTVRSLHLAGLVLGGGTALAADRRVLKAARSEPAARVGVVASLDEAHRVVVPALALMMVTGVLMTLSDTDTFFGSRLYGFKLSLVGLLLLNGLGLLLAERAVAKERPKGWVWLAVTSAASLALWLATLFTGVWLTVAA